jgi:chromosome segregation ATPase
MPADKLLAGIERLISPKLNEIIGELKAINGRIDSTNERIDSLRNETKADMARLEEKIDGLETKMDTKIDSLRTEMNVKFDSLEKRIPVIEKIAALELKIADLEKRLAVA